MEERPRILARTSADFEVVECNAAFYDLTGQSVAGSSLLKVLAPASGEEALASAISAASKGDICECHLSLCTARSCAPVLLRVQASLISCGEAAESLQSTSPSSTA